MYVDIGDPLFICKECNAYMWYEERINKKRRSTNLTFHMCYGNGKVQLPTLKDPPIVLQHLLFDNESKESKNYQNHIRTYNMMFVFTSPAAKVDTTFNNGKGPPNLRIQGQSCHRIGSLLPVPLGLPKFVQLYIYDTENEVQNRMKSLRYMNVSSIQCK